MPLLFIGHYLIVMSWIGEINKTMVRKDSQVAFQEIPDQDFIPIKYLMFISIIYLRQTPQTFLECP